jgi:nickel/cobalt exporter
VKRVLLGIAGIAVAAGSFGISAAPASAHPVDELVQQIYITPTTTGIDIGVELEPGIMVGPDFAAMLDTNGDGQISDAEADANAAVVRDAIHVTVDGQPATLTLSTSIYPHAEVLSAAGGSIALLFAVDASFTDGPTAITVTNGYVPTTPAAEPFTTTVQTNLTPAIDVPVTVAAMEHGDLGRSFSATYTLSAPPPSIGADAASTLNAAGTTSSDGETVVTLIGALSVIAVGAGIYGWRRRSRTARPVGRHEEVGRHLRSPS